MAVFKRGYGPYEGKLTPRLWRFMVPARYALMDLVQSRALMGFMALAYLPPLIGMSLIYLSHNPAARALLGLMKLSDLARIDERFFVQALSTQSFFGFMLAAWIGPNLVAEDLANGGLPLYLCRPFSRGEYILGKSIVIAGLGSAVLWLPVLLLYLANALMSGGNWWYMHWRIAGGLILGGLVWCSSVSLFVLSLSVWIKWRLLASASLVGLYLLSAGFAEALATALHLPWGRLFDLGFTFRIVWAGLTGAKAIEPRVPVSAAWLVLFVLACLSLFVLRQRVRAREVVR